MPVNMCVCLGDRKRKEIFQEREMTIKDKFADLYLNLQMMGCEGEMPW